MASLQNGHGIRRAAPSIFSRSFFRSGAINRMISAIRGEMSRARKNQLDADRPFQCATKPGTNEKTTHVTSHSMTSF